MKRKFYSGISIDEISQEIFNKRCREKLKEEREDLKIEQDKKVRKFVRRKLEEYVEEGYSIEEAINFIMERKEITEHFSYWTKNGIDIKQMFTSWAREPEHSNDGEER